MRSRRLLRPAVAFVALAAGQVGHLLTWELRQGPRALAPGGAGVHAYVPALGIVVVGLACAAVLSAFLAVAAARAVRPGRGGPASRASGRPVLDLWAALFAVQLTVFLVQETVEAAAAGDRLPSAGDLLLWGSAGQLPVAALAALVLRWLTPTVEDAVAELVEAAGRPLAARPALAGARSWPSAPVAPWRGPAVSAVTQRGPPALLRPA